MKQFGGINQIIQTVVLGTVILVPFVYVPLGSVHDFFYYPKYIALVIVTCTLLIICALNVSNLKYLFKFDLINKLLLSYFVLITISLFFSLDPILSIEGNFLRYDGYVTQIMYMLLFLFARTIHTIDKRFIYLVSISSAIVSIFGIIQYFGFDPFIRDLTRMFWTSAFSTFGNQNFFGSYLVLQIPFSLYIIVYHHQKWAYIPYSLSFIALLMTMTRGAWIGYFVSILFILITLYLQNKHKFIHNKHIWITMLLSTFIFISFNLLTKDGLSNRFYTMFFDSKILFTTSYSKNPDLIDNLGSVRMFIWIRVIELIKMRPLFGFGIENLHLAFARYFNEDIIRIMRKLMLVDKAHNDYLHIAVSSGIPSLLAYLSFLLTIAHNALKRFNQSINILLFTSILAYVVCLFFNISVVSVAYILWIYLGLISAYKISEKG